MCAKVIHAQFEKTVPITAFPHCSLAFWSLSETFWGVWLFSQQFLSELKLIKVSIWPCQQTYLLVLHQSGSGQSLTFTFKRNFSSSNCGWPVRWLSHNEQFFSASETVIKHPSIFSKCHILCLHISVWSSRIALFHTFQMFGDLIRFRILFSGFLPFSWARKSKCHNTGYVTFPPIFQNTACPYLPSFLADAGPWVFHHHTSVQRSEDSF